MRREWTPLFRQVAHSEKLAELQSDEHRLFFLLLLPQLDSWGRQTAKPRKLGAQVWPLLEKSASDVEKALQALQRVGVIRIYEIDGDPYLELPDWEAKAGRVGDQRQRKASLFPPPRATTAAEELKRFRRWLQESGRYPPIGSRPGWIYVLQAASNGSAKVGFTSDLERRLGQLRSEFGELELLVSAEGTLADESELHRRLTPWRDIEMPGREWYLPTPEAAQLIAEHLHSPGFQFGEGQ